MPRCARTISKTGIYHVMMRGNNGENIFIDHEDKERSTNVIYQKASIDSAKIYAHAIMDNHLHLIAHEIDKPLSLTIKRMGVAYAQFFNKKYKKRGHVFQDRFKSEPIESDRYLLAAICYVHLNPVKAGIGTLETYPWSSYQLYTGANVTSEHKEVLSMFSNDPDKAIRAFRELHSKENPDTFIDLPRFKYDTPEKVEVFIQRYLKNNGISKANLKERGCKTNREQLVRELNKNTDLSLREIAVLLDIGRETARKASLSLEPSR